MKKFFFLLLFSLAIPLQAASAGAASSPYYSMSIEKHDDDLLTGKLIGYLNSALPEGAVLQKTMPTEPVDGMIRGIFVQYTLGGSATRAPTTEVLGILKQWVIL